MLLLALGLLLLLCITDNGTQTRIWFVLLLIGIGK